MTSTANFFNSTWGSRLRRDAGETPTYQERIARLKELIAQADYIIIGAGAGLSTAAGVDLGGETFRREFREWIDRYGITDLYSGGFYPYETDEERWAFWAKHIWFARYQPEGKALYRQLLNLVSDRDYFVLTTNVDGQFEKAGFDCDRIFATQGDYGLFQPADGKKKETYSNKEWVMRALPQITDCRILTSLIPKTPDGQPVSMNLRCDDTFVEDEHWHRQADRYQQFLQRASQKRLLLLEFGVGFNTPSIIRFPFERIAGTLPHAHLIRFNRDYPQLMIPEAAKHTTIFTEDISSILKSITV